MSRRAAPTEPPKLTVSRQEAERLIQKQLDEAERLQAGAEGGEEDPRAFHEAVRAWDERNATLLEQIFNQPRYATEYANECGQWYDLFWYIARGEAPWDTQVALGYLLDKRRRLQSLANQIDVFQEAEQAAGGPRAAQTGGRPSGDIFVVHGRDHAAKNEVAGFIRELGLNPIILHKQPDEGHTIIEKIEKHAKVGFAVVLLTGDDVGNLNDEGQEPQPRARQNVVFEFGFFVGKLGRSNVRALYRDGVELPSDLAGMLYISYDEKGAWRAKLARELVAAKISIDQERLLKAIPR